MNTKTRPQNDQTDPATKTRFKPESSICFDSEGNVPLRKNETCEIYRKLIYTTGGV